MLLWVYLVATIYGYAYGTSTAPNLGHQNDNLNTLMQQLLNRTATLESQLAVEIQMRESLELEVQSKNDLTQFLRADVLRLNTTVQQEVARRQRLETNMAALSDKVANLESSLAERGEVQDGLKSTIRKINESLCGQLASLQISLHMINQSLVTWETSSNLHITSLNVTAIQNNKDIAKMAANMSTMSNGITDQRLNADHLNITMHNMEHRLDQIEHSSNTLTTSLQSRMQNLTTAQNGINGNIQRLNSTLASQRSDREVEDRKLRTLVTSIDARLTGLLNSFNGTLIQQKHLLESTSSALNQNVSLLQTIVANNQADIKLFGSSMHSLSSTTPMTTAAQAVMFSASRLHNPLAQTPKFDKVMTNIGAAFDPSLSLFTCPVSGAYLFTVSLQMADGVTAPAQCWIRRNGSLVISVYAQSLFPGTSASATNTVILQLQAGDRVELTRCTVGSMLLPDSSTFSGVLIAQI